MNQEILEMTIPAGNSINLTVREKSDYCTFCARYMTSNCNIAGEHICYECRDKFIDKIRLIMNFQ